MANLFFVKCPMVGQLFYVTATNSTPPMPEGSGGATYTLNLRSITAFQQCPIITHINCTIKYKIIIEIAEIIPRIIRNN